MGTCASGGNVITFAGELEKSSGGFGCMICTGEEGAHFLMRIFTEGKSHKGGG